MSCFLISNYYYVLAHEQIATFSFIIFKKYFHMLHITCSFLFYLILSYHSHDCSQNSETSKLQKLWLTQFQHQLQHNTQWLHHKSNISIKFSEISYSIFHSWVTQFMCVLTQINLMKLLQIDLTLNLHHAWVTIKLIWVKLICTLQIDNLSKTLKLQFLTCSQATC